MPIKRVPLVAASLLSADFSNMAFGIQTAENAGADWIHIDVMDGAFVPNITFGPKMVQDLRKCTDLPLDVHLMIERPERMLSAFIDAGADNITFHQEATVHIHRFVTLLKEAGIRAGLSLVPSTPVDHISEMLGALDLILVMTVNPGFGGQQIIPTCLDKVRKLMQLREQHGYDYLIEVDGGINRETAASARDAGSDVLISGSAFFSSDNPSNDVLSFKGIGVD